MNNSCLKYQINTRLSVRAMLLFLLQEYLFYFFMRLYIHQIENNLFCGYCEQKHITSDKPYCLGDRIRLDLILEEMCINYARDAQDL